MYKLLETPSDFKSQEDLTKCIEDTDRFIVVRRNEFIATFHWSISRSNTNACKQKIVHCFDYPVTMHGCQDDVFCIELHLGEMKMACLMFLRNDLHDLSILTEEIEMVNIYHDGIRDYCSFNKSTLAKIESICAETWTWSMKDKEPNILDMLNRLMLKRVNNMPTSSFSFQEVKERRNIKRIIRKRITQEYYECDCDCFAGHVTKIGAEMFEVRWRRRTTCMGDFDVDPNSFIMILCNGVELQIHIQENLTNFNRLNDCKHKIACWCSCKMSGCHGCAHCSCECHNCPNSCHQTRKTEETGYFGLKRTVGSYCFKLSIFPTRRFPQPRILNETMKVKDYLLDESRHIAKKAAKVRSRKRKSLKIFFKRVISQAAEIGSVRQQKIASTLLCDFQKTVSSGDDVYVGTLLKILPTSNNLRFIVDTLDNGIKIETKDERLSCGPPGGIW
jgi:hypothetical protein